MSSSTSNDDDSLMISTQDTGAASSSSSEVDDALILAVCEASLLAAQAGHALIHQYYESLYQLQIYEPANRGGSKKGKAKQ